MFRKILIACLCGVLAVALSACASGPAIISEMENALQENNIDVNEIINDMLSPAIDNITNANGDGQQEETTAEVAETEETTVAEETTAAEETTEEVTTEEVTTEEATTEEVTTEEETTEEVVTEEETTEEETTEEATTEEETTEEETTEEVTTEEETTEAESEEETTEEETTEAESKEETTEEETTEPESKEDATEEETKETIDYEKLESKAVKLSGDKAEVDGKEVSTLIRDGAFISSDIVYYEDMDKYPSGNYYGAGNRDEKHTKEEAEKNQVFNITEAGAYTITGEWKGQIKVDLGEGAKEDKDAKVVLILDGANISCSVAPAIVFENVYECDTEYVKEMKEAEEAAAKAEEEKKAEEKETESETSATEEKETTEAATEEETTSADDKEKITEEETKAEDVLGNTMPGNDAPEFKTTVEARKINMTDAGAVIVLAKGSENKISGSHVAEIYEDAKEQTRLVQQDGAVYSYMSMCIDAAGDDAVLNLVGDKEGISGDLHLAVNGGNINIYTEEDGINANADYASVVTVNGGNIYVAGGLSGTGDAIDSNGWIVINDGKVAANSAPVSDTGLDSELGTYINGGSVIAFGSDMQWADEGSEQVTMNVQFADSQKWSDVVKIKDTSGKTIYEYDPNESLLALLEDVERDYKGLVISDPELKKGETYHLFIGEVQQEHTGGIDLGSAPPDFSFDPFASNGIPGPEPFDGLYGDFGQGSFGLNDDVSNYYGNDNGLSDNIYENYYDNWYEDWFAESFEDLFKDHGIEMDEVEEYIETRNISFVPKNTVSTAIRSGETAVEEETTEEKPSLGANEPAKPGSLIMSEPSVEFKLADTVNYFGNVAAAGTPRDSGAAEEATTEETKPDLDTSLFGSQSDKEEPTIDETDLNSDVSPLSRRINFKRFF